MYFELEFSIAEDSSARKEITASDIMLRSALGSTFLGATPLLSSGLGVTGVTVAAVGWWLP